MGNLSSVVSLMGNQTVASISMGNVQGVLKKIQTESEITTSYFIYSSESGISVIEDLDELENFPNAFCIPAEAAKEALNQSAGSAFMGIFRFPNMSKSPQVGPISSADLTALTYITYIGCGLSLFFLSIGLFMHFLMRKVKATDSLRVLINLFVALFLLNVAFLSNEYVARAKDDTACKVMAGFMHYCLLASFNWFAVEAFHLCLQMAKHSITIKHYMIKISVFGWAPPALVVSIIFVLGKYGEQTIKTESSNVTMCWILDSNVHYYVNIGYYCLIFIFTFSTFIVVLRWLSMLKLSKFNEAGKVKRSGTATSDITTILGLCCMLGITWSFAFFSFGAMRLPSYYIFTILNSFQ
ncbi:hypothetical protein cypCar_00034395, partial [Cyprinus carpio]